MKIQAGILSCCYKIIELAEYNPKRITLYCFWLATAVYLFITWFTFKGFNGSDDLHYAMLASNMVKGTYSPFASNDIFSGRMLMVAWQALIYYFGGINAFTTQAGTLITAVLCCYLTIFKLGKFTAWQTVLAGTALFYFNPVLKEATTGVLPDVYIMLAGIVILILWKQIEAASKINWFKAACCGLIAFAAMFFKENALVFIPFLLIVSFTGVRKRTVPAGLTAIAAFATCVLLSGVMYYHFTGNFFFRVLQIQNADYPNPCSYGSFTLHEKITRLTYGVWQQFIVESFYPVILAALLLLFRLPCDRVFKIKENSIAKSFLILLILGLYFPFSLKGYQPLCFMARHFIFLLPPAVLLCTSFLEEATTNKVVRLLLIAVSAVILVVCINSTHLKWYWMIYSLLLAYFSIIYFINIGGGQIYYPYSNFISLLTLPGLLCYTRLVSGYANRFKTDYRNRLLFPGT